MNDIKRKMARGALWMVLASFSNRALGLLSTLVLARLLIPADFGLVAMAMSVVAMVELLTAFSFDSALVSNRSAPVEHYHTAWTLNILFMSAAGMLLLLIAWPAALFYEDPRLTPIIAVIGGSIFIQGFENVGIVAFRKEMTFGREFAFIMGKRLAGLLTTIPIAIVTHSYWALVIGIVTSRVAGVLLSYFMHPFRPHPSLRSWRELLGFSRWLLMNNVLHFLNSRSTDFIIGKTGGATQLGLYSLSYEIATLPTSEIVAPINRAVLPGYAQLARDRGDLRRGYLDVMAAVALLALPVSFGLAATSDLAVHVLLGDKWTAAAPLIAVIAFYGAVTALDSNSYSAYLALGKPSIPTLLAGIRVAVLLPSLILLTPRFGAAGAAWALLLVGLVLTPAGLAILFRLLDLQWREFISILWRPLVSGACMFAVVRKLLPEGTIELAWRPAALHLLLAVGAGALTYAILVWGLWKVSGCEGRIERQFMQRLRSPWAA